MRENIKVSNEIVTLCKSLKRKHIKLGIVSDGTVVEGLEALTYLGVIEYFDSIVVSEEFGFEKPDPRLFRNALNQLRVNASETLMVGDDPARDIIGAKNVGIKTALVTQYSRKTPPRSEKEIADIVVGKVTEILSFMEKG